MDKWEGKYNVTLRRNYFFVNISLLTVVFRQQVKKTTVLGKINGFLKFAGEMEQLIRKHSQKIN